jgi:hypothetical protein
MGDSPDPRENLTAALVRDYDDEQLVLWIHALQDREEELEAEVERLEAQNAALRGNPTSTVQVRSLGIAWPTGDLFNELVEARAEVERLRRELDALQIAHNLLAESYARVQKRVPDPDDLRLIEELSEVAHNAYEAAAAEQGWVTNPRSRVPWEEVPDANRATTRAAIRAVLARLRATLGGS